MFLGELIVFFIVILAAEFFSLRVLKELQIKLVN